MHTAFLTSQRLRDRSSRRYLNPTGSPICMLKVAAKLYQIARDAAEEAQIKAKELEKTSAELQEALQTLESQISARIQVEASLHKQNEVLQLLQVVAAAANEAVSSEEALQICLDRICAYTGWPVGHVYNVNSTGQLAPSNLWSLKDPERFAQFRAITEVTYFSPGVGLPGEVLVSSKPKWIEDVNKAENFPRSKQACEIEVKAGFAFPVFVGADVVAVMEFFSCEELEQDELLLEIAANVGTQLGRVIERERSQQALKESEAKAKAQALELEQTLLQLKQAQAQLIQTEKMSSLGQMVAGVAHEINNPVNFIHGNLAYVKQYSHDLLELVLLYQKHYSNPCSEIRDFTEDIELDFLSEDMPKVLSSMQIGTERIQEIVLSLRNFSRLDQAEIKPVNIHEGLDSTLLILQNRFKAKPGSQGITVEKEYGDLPLVECYPGQLNQVFMNIISNAADALDEQIQQKQGDNYPLPTIKISTEYSHSDYITVRIADNGPGMSSEVKARLFDPFFTTKPVGKGTGLGLSICYQIVVEKHGGGLKCISEPGKGVEFLIEIPLLHNNTPTT